jgi:hypothetical protein
MKIISYLIFIFYFSVIQAAIPAFDPTQYRSYENGCLEEVLHPEPVRISPVAPASLSLSAGMVIRRAEEYLPDIPPRAEIYMDVVTSQRGLGSCTAFAIVAGLESLVKEVSFSEAELYIRVKTKGRSDRMQEGVALSDYIPLLSEGAVHWYFFPRYDSFVEYTRARKDARLPLTSSADYRESIEDFRTWCKRSGRYAPDSKPSWKEETYETRIDMPNSSDVVFGKALCYFNPFYWGLRLVSDQPGLRFERTVTRTRFVLEPHSYHPRRFRMYPVVVYSASHPKDPFYRIKFALSSRKPVVISFQIYKMPETKEWDLWDELLYTGTSSVIDLPPRDAVYAKRNHAVCLCGYDDERQAFRFKNSWGINWGDHGYAWITYDYVKEHTNSAFVIEIME